MGDFSHLWGEDAAELATILASEGFEVRVVGGAVRDALLGMPPKDIDLATDATPDELLAVGQRWGIRTIPLLKDVTDNPQERLRGGLKHGTVPFVLHGTVLDVTTLRVDGHTAGRHAEVQFVRDFRRDAARRDFTFNAMSVSRDGTLHDYFGGVQDLRSGTVRFVGNASDRIREDYLRILRFYRFSLKFSIAHLDHKTAQIILGSSAGLSGLAGERIWSEMARIISDVKGVALLPEMQEAGVTQAIGLTFQSGRLDAATRAARSGAHPAAVLGCLVDGPDSLPALRRMWRLSTADFAIASYVSVKLGEPEPVSTELMDLALAPGAKRDHLAHYLTAIGRQHDALTVSGPLPSFPVSGSDIVAAGVEPGAEVGHRLIDIHGAWKASRYSATRETLLLLLDGAASPSPSQGSRTTRIR